VDERTGFDKIAERFWTLPWAAPRNAPAGAYHGQNMTAPRRIQNAKHRQKAYQADVAVAQALA